MSSGLSQEDFQDYMDGGLRRRRVVRSAAKKPKAVTKRPVAHKAKPKAVAKRPASKMAKLFGGFFESLEDFANETAAAKEKKVSKVESYADDKNPMDPLAVKGGKPKAKPKAKKPKARRVYMGGYEEEQDQEQEQSEEFMDINEALTQAKQLISGGYYRPRAAVRRAAPARRASSPRRAAPAVRRASPTRRRRVVRRSV
jgi:hypothetical protein